MNLYSIFLLPEKFIIETNNSTDLNKPDYDKQKRFY
jgi:hypothetical protein